MAGHGPSKYKPGEVAWGSEHHILPVKVYRNTIIWLFVLMGATIGASYLPYPDTAFGTAIANLIALGIALIKASLVVLFFMHVKYSSMLVRFWALLGFGWMLLLFFILVDYGTRQIDPSIARPWMHDPGSATPQHINGRTVEESDPFGVNVRPRH